MLIFFFAAAADAAYAADSTAIFAFDYAERCAELRAFLQPFLQLAACDARRPAAENITPLRRRAAAVAILFSCFIIAIAEIARFHAAL